MRLANDKVPNEAKDTLLTFVAYRIDYVTLSVSIIISCRLRCSVSI
jgi:hypothetical protein